MAPLAAADPHDVETLLDAAFGAARRMRTAYRLREGCEPMPKLSFAAFAGDVVVATLQTWPIELAPTGEAPLPLLLIGPVAVAPELQRGGIGKALMAHGLAAIDDAEEHATVLIGDPAYYERLFGFSARPTQRWELPGPLERHRLLARLTGGVTLPAKGTLRARS